ncbi:NUMOD3 motif (2 copies) [uncultured archaeon]|nr:NUMOD3 motif (2 copies) [uncultured archaeon]
MPKKLNIGDMRRIAESRSGKCLSEKYTNNHTKLKWQCREGHIWENTPAHIKRRQWCPYCAGEVIGTIEMMQEIAKSRGGECLSTKYKNSKTPLEWRCKEFHVWKAVPGSIKHGSWCLVCAGRARGTIGEMQNIAKSRGGKCLSEDYTNSQTNLRWQCKDGHIWRATPNNIKQEKWCPYCVHHVKLTIEEMRSIAESRGGKCLSDEYVNDQTKLRWQCDKGHIWEAVPNSIKQGGWCPYCMGRGKTIEGMQKVAKLRNGWCLSTEFINSKHNLKWQCKNGHVWEANYSNISNGKWCPICSAGVSERICRKFFEVIFKQTFPKARPRWLISPVNRTLELDGYCKEIGLAFEYHGEQHFKEMKHFHRKTSFSKRLEYDELKRELCKRNNVVLIEVPYTVKFEGMQQYIISECLKHGVHIPELGKIDYRQFNDVYSSNLLEKTDAIARSKGGRCLSTRYINSETKLEYECKNRHRFFVRPRHIERSWCPYCSHRARHTLEDMQKLAEYKGGKCLSTEYVNVHSKLEWQCKFGHIWKAVPENVIQGRWCPVCARGRVPWNKGTKGVVVAWNKGKPMNEKMKKKLSMALAGHVPWNKGKKGMQTAWNKGMKGIMPAPWNKGKTGVYSDDAKKKMSDSHKGKITWISGRHHNEESKKKMSESAKHRKKSVSKKLDKMD